MKRTVQFNAQSSFQNIEIEDEISGGELPSYLEPESVASESAPKNTLTSRHSCSKFSGKVSAVFVSTADKAHETKFVVLLRDSFSPTLTLPRGSNLGRSNILRKFAHGGGNIGA